MVQHFAEFFWKRGRLGQPSRIGRLSGTGSRQAGAGDAPARTGPESPFAAGRREGTIGVEEMRRWDGAGWRAAGEGGRPMRRDALIASLLGAALASSSAAASSPGPRLADIGAAPPIALIDA